MEISSSAPGKCWRRSRSKDSALCWDLHITEAKVPFLPAIQPGWSSCSSQVQAGPSFLWKLIQISAEFLLSVVGSPGWSEGLLRIQAVPGKVKEQELPLLPQPGQRGGPRDRRNKSCPFSHSLDNLELPGTEGTRADPVPTAWTIWSSQGHRAAPLAAEFSMLCRCQATALSLPQ